MVPDVWSYLTATPGVNPANWLNRAETCSSPSGPLTCLITGADGQPLNAEVVSNGDNWVVTGLAAG